MTHSTARGPLLGESPRSPLQEPPKPSPKKIKNSRPINKTQGPEISSSTPKKRRPKYTKQKRESRSKKRRRKAFSRQSVAIRLQGESHSKTTSESLRSSKDATEVKIRKTAPVREKIIG